MLISLSKLQTRKINNNKILIQCVSFRSPWNLRDVVVDGSPVGLIVQMHLFSRGVSVPGRVDGQDDRGEVGGDRRSRRHLVPAEQPLGSGIRPDRRLGAFRHGVSHALQYPHEEDVRRQIVDLGLDEDAALRTTELPVRADYLLQAFFAERVLTRQHLARRVQPLEADRALEQVV